MPVGKPDRESWTYLSKACLSSMCTGSHSQHCKAKQANKNKGTQTEFLSPSLFVCKRMMQEIERKGEGFYLTPKCTPPTAYLPPTRSHLLKLLQYPRALQTGSKSLTCESLGDISDAIGNHLLYKMN